MYPDLFWPAQLKNKYGVCRFSAFNGTIVARPLNAGLDAEGETLEERREPCSLMYRPTDELGIRAEYFGGGGIAGLEA